MSAKLPPIRLVVPPPPVPPRPGTTGNPSAFKDSLDLWKKYCEHHGKSWMTETFPPRDNPKIIEFLRSEVSNPSGQPFKSGKELMRMADSSGGKRSRKHHRSRKHKKTHRRR